MCLFPRRCLLRVAYRPVWLLLCAVLAAGLHAAESPTQKRKGGSARGNIAKGQAPASAQWWRTIDTGPSVSDTIYFRPDGSQTSW